MKTLIVVGLIAATASAQAPDSVAERIYHESWYDQWSRTHTNVVAALRTDGTYKVIIHEALIQPLEPYTNWDRVVKPGHEGTYSYLKTSPHSATLAIKLDGSDAIEERVLLFDHFGLGSFARPHVVIGGGFISSTYTSPVVNLSSRGVASADKPLIVGFYVSGRPAYALVRAVGPSLGQFDVAGAAEDTILEVVPASAESPLSGVTLGNWNDDWEVDQFSTVEPGAVPAVVAIGSFMGAFPLAEGSKDSAIVLWLIPGAYTAIIRTKSETPAEVLGEVYIVP